MEAIIIQIVLFQLVFWLFYEVFLRKETFFKANRFYLIVSSVLSFVLPFLKTSYFKKNFFLLQEQLANNLPAVFLRSDIKETPANGTVVLQPIKGMLTIENLWVLGAIVFLLILLYKLVRLVYIEKTHRSRWQDDYVLVQLPNTNEAFSFFNRIFLGSQLTNPERKTILEHEKVHVEQYHSADLLWFELLRVVFWFNPIIYLYQRRIAEVHEYLVDEKVSDNQSNYCEELLAHSFGVPQFSLVNQFYKSSLIKNRIIMLTKEKSNPIKLVKYLAVAPMLLVMLFYTSSIQIVSAQEKAEVKKLKSTTDLEVPFAVIDQVPVYPGCNENGTKEEMKKCFARSVSILVNENFNIKIAETANLKGVQRIVTKFVVAKDGTIKEIKVNAPHPELEKETRRVISLLPQMKPGMHKGKPVKVPYALPIQFKIEEKAKKS